MGLYLTTTSNFAQENLCLGRYGLKGGKGKYIGWEDMVERMRKLRIKIDVIKLY